MQVLKFGGSSVGTADAILKVVDIVSETIKKEPTIVVVSAMSGVTDQLLMLAQSASQGNEAYKTIIENIEQKHLDAVRVLLPIQAQSATLSLVKQTINELESVLINSRASTHCWLIPLEANVAEIIFDDNNSP